MIVHPKDVEKLTASGLGNMATLADESVSPRFDIEAVRFALVYFRLVIQNGMGRADLTIYQRHRFRTGFHDFPLFEYVDIGELGGEVNRTIDLRIQPQGLMHYTFDRGPDGIMDSIAPVWTNPNSGTMRWAIEVGLVDVEKISV